MTVRYISVYVLRELLGLVFFTNSPWSEMGSSHSVPTLFPDPYTIYLRSLNKITLDKILFTFNSIVLYNIGLPFSFTVDGEFCRRFGLYIDVSLQSLLAEPTFVDELILCITKRKMY